MENFGNIFFNKKIVDLTHNSDENSPFWPSEGTAQLSICPYNQIEKDGCFSLNIKLSAGFGTHMDAPSHFVKDGRTISDLELKDLIGNGLIIDIEEKCKSNPDYELTIEDILYFEKNYGKIIENSIIILKTGWYKFFKDKEKYINSNPNEYCEFINVGKMHFPGYSKESAKFLVKERDCKGIGIDTLSPDKGCSDIFNVHDIILKNNKYILENLNLEETKEGFCTLICLPMKIKGLSESPVRVIALYDN